MNHLQECLQMASARTQEGPGMIDQQLALMQSAGMRLAT
jgi:hypothetical protein